MLNKSKGNMYNFITHTWNPIKGKCCHDCAYCYMKRFGEQKPIRLDEKEMKTDLGEGNFIFVGSSCDLFAQDIPNEWIDRIIQKCINSKSNFFFQTKNPSRILKHIDVEKIKNWTFCTTIETNRYYKDIMGESAVPFERANFMNLLNILGLKTYVTIEPIIDFDLNILVEFVQMCNPKQVNIGADSKGHNLPEPSPEKIEKLVESLEKFTRVELKDNLVRILGI